MILNNVDSVNIAQPLGFIGLRKLPNASNSIYVLFPLSFCKFYLCKLYLMFFGQKQIVNTKFSLQNVSVLKEGLIIIIIS